VAKIKRHKVFLKDFANTKLTDGQFEEFVFYVALMRDNKRLPEESKDHALKGSWSDFRECHLGGDMLLAYRQDEDEITLARIGTHSELFG
jgi:mRNA interferase YafQ